MEAMGPMLRPALAAELDLNANWLDTEQEVKKLQRLVWKLEWQNEQLRNRSGGSGGLSPNLVVAEQSCCQPFSSPSLFSESAFGSLQNLEDQSDYFLAQCGENGDKPSLLDELELLDLNSPSFSDESEETWLYMSSRGPQVEQQLGPLQWSRLGLDAQAARCSLFQQMKPGHVLRCATFCPTSAVGGRDDNEDKESIREKESIHLGYKPHDLTDVQLIARLQKESLRQYYASMSPWLLQSRGCCHRSQSFSRGLKEEDLPPGSSPLPPGLAHFCTFSRGRDWSRDSLGSYPTLGLRQGHGQGPGMGLCPRTGLDTLSLADPQVFRPTSDKLRRSLPSLLPYSSLPCIKACSHFRPCNLSFDSSSAMTSFHSSALPPGRLQQGSTLPSMITTNVGQITTSTTSSALPAMTGNCRSSIPVHSWTDAARSYTTSPTSRNRGHWRQI